MIFFFAGSPELSWYCVQKSERKRSRASRSLVHIQRQPKNVCANVLPSIGNMPACIRFR